MNISPKKGEVDRSRETKKAFLANNERALDRMGKYLWKACYLEARDRPVNGPRPKDLNKKQHTDYFYDKLFSKNKNPRTFGSIYFE